MHEINLYDLLKYYAHHWVKLMIAICIGAAIGIVYTSLLQQPLFKSEATMLVVSTRSSQDATINNNYTEVFKSRRVLDTVIRQQGYDGGYDQLLARTSATNDKNTDILKVSIADPDPNKSKQLLQASLESFKQEVGTLYDSDNIKTVDAASLPSGPYNVNVVMQIGLTTIAALFLAIIVMFFVYDYRLMSRASTRPHDDFTEEAVAANIPMVEVDFAATPVSREKSKRLGNMALRRLLYLLVGGNDTIQRENIK